MGGYRSLAVAFSMMVALSVTSSPAQASDSAAFGTDPAKVADQLQSYIDKHPTTLGGGWVDKDGKVVVYVSDDSAADEVKRDVSRWGLSPEIQHSKYSIQKLRTARDAVAKGMSQGKYIEITWVSIEADASGLVVMAPEGAGVTEEAEAETGVRVRRINPERSETAVGRQDDHAPFFGGSRIKWTSGANEYSCTSGFSVRSPSNTQYLLTAAHCSEWAQTFLNGTGTASAGTVAYRTYGGGTDDQMLLAGPSSTGTIYTGGPNGSTSVPVRGTYSVTCWGCDLYFGGSATGQTRATTRAFQNMDGGCAQIHDGRTNRDFVACHLIRVQAASGWGDPCTHGDSGGPVYVYDGSGGVLAVGIVTSVWTDGSCDFTRIQPILATYSATVATS